jgi:hypothetical protein
MSSISSKQAGLPIRNAFGGTLKSSLPFARYRGSQTVKLKEHQAKTMLCAASKPTDVEAGTLFHYIKKCAASNKY